MAPAPTQSPYGGQHTAGIYADMTVDGPEIGTLVVIIDRAKNLPNRKSMGKQDPYCAARLGKEAKKTDTDKRGGQTPRWDQELRFTVHDSPDYNQLKLSVFNDDKKTELIGETFVNLEEIVKPGGGSSDTWHRLSCKARFAGEIRIELTYYDTRPRAPKEETTPRHSISNSVDSPKERLRGPRQSQTPTRRPLPANPGASAQSSPQPETQLVAYQDQSYNPQYATEYQDPQDQVLQSIEQPDFPEDPEFDLGPGHEHALVHDFNRVQPLNIPYNTRSSMYEIPSRPFNGEDEDFSGQYHGQDQRKSASPFGRQPYGEEYQYTPPMKLGQPRPSRSQDFNTIKTRKIQSSPSMDLIPHSQSFDGRGAPPPPAHRSSLPARPTDMNGPQNRLPEQRSIAAPIPLRNSRANSTDDAYFPTQGSPLKNELVSGRPSFDPRMQRPNPHPAYPSGVPDSREMVLSRTPDQHGPSSLVSGRGPPDPRRFRATPERQSTGQQDRFGSDMYQQQHRGSLPLTQRVSPRASFASDRTIDSVSTAPTASSIGRSEPITPEGRRPVRKSVSPNMEAIVNSSRQSSQSPFSPDSFNALNPNMDSASEFHSSGPSYNTPDQAREAAVQHERAEKQGDGPIIGNDGRIIDPSDHLPTETWAPEPEPRGQRKGPEVTLRFKHDTQHRQSAPLPIRAPLAEARPNATPTPKRPEVVTTGVRARLQKRLKGLQQPASSPIVPTIGKSPSDPAPLRSYASEIHLPERENLPSGNYSPPYSPHTRGYDDVPPPIPRKIPLHPESPNDYWGPNSLSDELSRIDLGPSGGHSHRGSPRGSYGFRDV